MRNVIKNYTVSEVAKQIDVSVSTVRNLINKGELEKAQDNPVMVSRSSVIRYKAKTNKFEEIDGKVEVIHTHLGQVRKILKYDAYMVIDISSVIGLVHSGICKTVKSDALIKYEECREYGLIPQSKGYALVTLNTIRKYLNTSLANVDKDRFLMELLIGDIKQEFPNSKVEIDKDGVLDVDLTNEEQEPTKQELTEYQNMMMFNGNSVEVIVVDGNPMFELYSTGMALGYVNKNSKGVSYPHKSRIDKVIKNADISTCVHGVHSYITEPQLYDFMLEAKTDKCRPFRKWVTSEVLPTIRKTGGYVAHEDKFTDNYFGDLPEDTKQIIKDSLEKNNQQLKIDRAKAYANYQSLDEKIKKNEEVIKKLDK